MKKNSVLFFVSLLFYACPGTLENPEDFGSCTNPNNRDDPLCSNTNCLQIVTDLIQSDCLTGCHSTAVKSSQLDLQASGLPKRLVKQNAASAGCSGLLLDPANPKNSNFYKKLTATPPCGTRMPVGGTLTTEELNCVSEWIATAAN